MKTFIIDDHEKIEEIIRSAQTCFIAINDPGNAPYIIPMNFGYENGTFYLHSGHKGKKIDLAQNDNRISLSLHGNTRLVFQHPDVACSYSMSAESIVCEGKVRFITDYDEKIKCLNTIMRHYTQRDFKYNAPAVNNICIWELKPEQISCKSFGNSAKRQII